jgi:hypothetical protein
MARNTLQAKITADAVFASELQRSDEPGPSAIRTAVQAAMRTFGSCGCAARVAQEFGDHPEAAAARMRWALSLAGESFGSARAKIAQWPPATRPGASRGKPWTRCPAAVCTPPTPQAP